MKGPQRRRFYASSPTGQLMAVDITTQPTFQQGTPRVVLEEGFRGWSPARKEPTTMFRWTASPTSSRTKV